jgi:hypothetical protein
MSARQLLAVLGVVSVVGLAALTRPAQAQPSADQILADIGLSAEDKQKVLNGEFVTPDLAGVSETDLSISIVFVVKTSPEALSKQILAGDLITVDSQVQAYGKLSPKGSLADLAGLRIADGSAQTLSSAQAGEALNLGTREIAAFKALSGGAPAAVQAQLQKMLLARYQAYLASGLTAIVPYDRGGGRTTDPGVELRKASQAARGLEKYMPAFKAVLLGYPKATVPGMEEDFRWVHYDIRGKPTYVLVHWLSAATGAARAVVQRQYYVSTGYNAQQAVAGFLPIQGGTLVVYASHAFTDQVAGFGGSLKRGIGRHVMTDKMTEMFEVGRTKVRQ